MFFLFGAEMDRVQVFPGAIPLETDLLNTNKNTMVGLAKLAAAMLGTSTQVNGLSVIATGPASLQVNVTPGEIYQLVNLDGTAYSSLAADTTHQIVKQGILLDQVALNCPAPATAGFSVNYLIEATYSDVDALPVVLPYYNASNPAVAYSGPANAGTTNNTVRQGKVTLTAKAGTAATTGTQTTPAADAGYVGLYVVTVANGQTQITAPNIVQAAGAPVINTTLLGLAPAFNVSPTAPSPAQFDTSNRIATMSAVQQALGNRSNFRGVSTSVTLTAADAGAAIFAQGGAAITITLPLLSTVPVGASVEVTSQSLFAVTVSRQGADFISVNNALNNTTSTAIGNGDSAYFVKLSTTAWIQVSGSAQLGNAASFGSSKASNGYQKLPGGVIIQWGSGTPVSAGVITVNYPIAFPNGVFLVAPSPSGGNNTANASGITLSSVTLTMFQASNAAALNGSAVYYIAIGY